jgi:hypothetical protein
MMLDDLELELRKLPGVRAAGFDDREDVLMVQLHMASDVTTSESEVPIPIAATRIAARHCDRPVAVEVVRWRDAPSTIDLGDIAAPAPISTAFDTSAARPEQAAAAATHSATRPRLLAVLSFPDTDEIEVHLVYAGQRTIGRSKASRGLIAAVEAALEGVRGLGAGVTATASWARPIESTIDGVALVAIALDDRGSDLHRYGVAAGVSEIEAAARATLNALNRQLDRLLG